MFGRGIGTLLGIGAIGLQAPFHYLFPKSLSPALWGNVPIPQPFSYPRGKTITKQINNSKNKIVPMSPKNHWQLICILYVKPLPGKNLPDLVPLQIDSKRWILFPSQGQSSEMLSKPFSFSIKRLAYKFILYICFYFLCHGDGSSLETSNEAWVIQKDCDYIVAPSYLK